MKTKIKLTIVLILITGILAAQNDCADADGLFSIDNVSFEEIQNNNENDFQIDFDAGQPFDIELEEVDVASGENERMIWWLHGLGGDEDAFANAHAYVVVNYKVQATDLITYTQAGNLTAAAAEVLGITQIQGSSLQPFLVPDAEPRDNFAVGHSLGGIVAKATDKLANDTNVPDDERYLGGIVTLGSSHSGSKMVDNFEEIKLLAATGVSAMALGPMTEAGESIFGSLLGDILGIELDEPDKSGIFAGIVSDLKNVMTQTIASSVLSTNNINKILDVVSPASVIVLEKFAAGNMAPIAQSLTNAVGSEIHELNNYDDSFLDGNKIAVYGTENTDEAALRVLHHAVNDINDEGAFINPNLDNSTILLWNQLLNIYNAKQTEWELIKEEHQLELDLLIDNVDNFDPAVFGNAEELRDAALAVEAAYQTGINYLEDFNTNFGIITGSISPPYITPANYECLCDPNQPVIVFDLADQCSDDAGVYCENIPNFWTVQDVYTTDGIVPAYSAKGMNRTETIDMWGAAVNVEFPQNNHFELKNTQQTKAFLDLLLQGDLNINLNYSYFETSLR